MPNCKTVVPYRGTPEQEERLRKVIAEHKGQPGATMPVLQAAQEIFGYLPEEQKANDEDAEIDALVAERAEARKAKNFKRSDEIRDMLAAKGIVIEDTPQGPRWKRNI